MKKIWYHDRRPTFLAFMLPKDGWRRIYKEGQLLTLAVSGYKKYSTNQKILLISPSADIFSVGRETIFTASRNKLAMQSSGRPI